MADMRGDRDVSREPRFVKERVQFWDFDEPEARGGIVTLRYGWSFEHTHEGVKGFDTIKEARGEIEYATPCRCEECLENMK